MADGSDDTRRIIRFMLIKAAIFIGIPVVAAAFAILFLMPCPFEEKTICARPSSSFPAPTATTTWSRRSTTSPVTGRPWSGTRTPRCPTST
ncbi:conserved hypothetical protein [uncultured Pleomorphomonas sp.]|uniref:Uncharacterized protein n=1 Tax=uncultured Pleomorphomonas sp. TaxID=442121 RepID=A0A212L5E4_9HYPH|nr:conserved hypothetical protein [uncultured Pleomorphomonas sp.]